MTSARLAAVLDSPALHWRCLVAMGRLSPQEVRIVQSGHLAAVLGRLVRKGVARRERGLWGFADPMLRTWLRSRRNISR